MTQPQDDIEALKIIVSTLAGFERKDQERLLRWTKEKLSLSEEPRVLQMPAKINPEEAQGNDRSSVDIKTFIGDKDPKSDNQLAAVVAYYYKFEAPNGERKDSITGDELQEACRKSGRSRLKSPIKTLNNAHMGGLLDKVAKGAYSINTVGENLVVMALPSGSAKKTVKKTGPKGGR